MKRIEKLTAFALSLILASSTVVSCSKNDDNANPDNTPDNSEEVQIKAELEVPKGIAEGKTFSIYLAMTAIQDTFIAEEENGNDLNDAVFQRNKLVKDHTGVELEFTQTTRGSGGGDQQAETNQIRTLIQSGDDTYDAFIHVQHSGMPSLIEEGLFVNWNDLPYVNLDNPWWYSNVVRDICFGDKVFCMTGDYNYRSFAITECLLFNKTLCDELGLEYPYQMVFDGKWTHDRFVEYIKKATKDLNGDGTLDRDNDRYGFGGWQYEQILALFAGYGGEAIGKDDDNLPVLNIDREITYTVIDKMLEVFDCEGSFYEGVKYGVDDKMFNEGRLLFNDSFLSSVVGARSLENIDVGFIPYPKLSEDQEEYYSRNANISGLTYIPVTNTDLEKTGAVLEALAYYSADTLMPTYFDIILTIKSTRDIESEQVIPIIRNSSRFMDQVIGFNGSNIVTAQAGNTLSSHVAANKDAWQIKIDSLIETYSE